MPDPPLRVCHLASGDSWAGAEQMLLNLASEQRRAGLRVDAILLNEGRLADELRTAGVHVEVIPETHHGFRRLLRMVRDRLESLSPDVVHSHRYKENLLALLSRSATCVVTLHGSEPPQLWVRRPWVSLRRAIQFTLARVTNAQLVSVSAELRGRFGLDAKRCHVIHNGVPIPEPVPRERRRPPRIGWLGRMVPIKGLPLLLQAAAACEGPDAPRLLLAGDGPERASLEREAQALGIADRVEFRGFLEDPEAFYRELDILALPSLHEGVPLVVLEAMAAGVPVVAARVGGLPEVIEDGETGLLVNSRDAESWASVFQGLSRDPERGARLGDKARASVRERLSVKAMHERYLRIYRREDTPQARNAALG